MQFETDTVNAFNAFKTAGITNLLIDLTNNGGTAKHFTSLIDNIFSNLSSYIIFRGLCLPWPVLTSVPSWFTNWLSVCSIPYRSQNQSLMLRVISQRISIYKPGKCPRPENSRE